MHAGYVIDRGGGLRIEGMMRMMHAIRSEEPTLYAHYKGLRQAVRPGTCQPVRSRCLPGILQLRIRL